MVERHHCIKFGVFFPKKMAKEKWDRNREEIQKLVQRGKIFFEGGSFLNHVFVVIHKIFENFRNHKKMRHLKVV